MNLYITFHLFFVQKCFYFLVRSEYCLEHFAVGVKGVIIICCVKIPFHVDADQTFDEK